MSYKILLVGWLVLLTLGLNIVVVDAQRPPPGGRRSQPSQPVFPGVTFQGLLKNNGAPVSGSCDLAFRLYDDASAGNQIGSSITQTIPITNGLFTTQLNAGNEFGANAFNGDARWLDIMARCLPASGFTSLTPREPVTPAPYALTALKTAYKNVLVVAKSGGHYNTISDALASIGDNSASNRYLIYVAPGTYTETVTMKPYVDIEGAGELTTKITQVGTLNSITGTVVGANNAELRFLTIENTGAFGLGYAVAIFNSSASPRLTHITASASGGGANYAVYNSSSSPTMMNVSATASGGGASVNIGVRNESSSPTMMNVTASASGGSSGNIGVSNSSSSPTMVNVTASASGGTGNYGVSNGASSPAIQNSVISASGGSFNYGIYNSAASGAYTVTVNNSQVTGSTNTIFNNTNFTTRVGASKLDGGAVAANGGTVTCAGVYNANYTFYASTCP